MENKNNVGGMQDVSSFLLVEGTADSESDYGLLELSKDATIACSNINDDDDAESCSCDTRDAVDFHEGFGCKNEDCSEGNGYKRSRSDPNWRNCMLWLRDVAMECMATEEGEEESKVGSGIHLNREVTDQMEDRLFWETCMAIGYP